MTMRLFQEIPVTEVTVPHDLPTRLHNVEKWIDEFSNPYFHLDRMVVVTGIIRSANYIKNERGWRMSKDGTLEANNGYFRGEIRASVMAYDEVSVTNGELWITDAAVLGEDVAATDTEIVTSRNVDIFKWTSVSTGTATSTLENRLVNVGSTGNPAADFVTDGVEVGWTVWNTTDNTYARVEEVINLNRLRLSADIFASGDSYKVGYGPIVLLRTGGVLEYMGISSGTQVASIKDVDGSIKAVNKYGVIRDLDGSGANAWKAGTAIASTRIKEQGWIVLDAQSAANDYPIIDMRKRNNYAYNGYSTPLRIGRLDGFTGNTLTGITPTGWGLYCENVFLKGEMHATNARIYNKLIVGSELGAGISLGDDVSGWRVADKNGRPHFVIDKDTGEVRIGYPPDHPSMKIHNGVVTIDSAALVVSTVGKTFIDSGLIILTTVDVDWNDPTATGIRIAAGEGITSKQSGTQNVEWNATTGQISFGPSLKGRINAAGLGYTLDLLDYDEASFLFTRSDNELYPLGGFIGATEPYAFEVRQESERDWATAKTTIKSGDLGNIALGNYGVASYKINLTAGGELFGPDPNEMFWETTLYPMGYETTKTDLYLGYGGSLRISNDPDNKNPVLPNTTTLVYVAGEFFADSIVASGEIMGALSLPSTRVAISEDNWAIVPAGTIAVVVDDVGDYTLRVKSESGGNTWEYKTTMTRELMA